VPIIMVSAAVETEARLQGLARGADDYVAKPFSPKELIARIRNLLARSAESRDARRRGLLAERELQGARDEAKRSQEGLKDEQHLRDLGRILTWSFEGLLDD
jgi:two-component system phosphate regulon response regulator OmpR